MQTGDRIQLIIENDGTVSLLAQNLDVSKIYGILKTSKKASTGDMNEAIAKRERKKMTK